MTDTPKPAPATPAATPLREANQQRVDAAVQRLRKVMDYRKYLPGCEEFHKDVELLIEIALAPVLEIFAAAQPAATPEDVRDAEKTGEPEAVHGRDQYPERFGIPEIGRSADAWWVGASLDVIRHARTSNPEDWHNAIMGGLLRAYNRGKDELAIAMNSEAPQKLPAAAQPQRESESLLMKQITCTKCGHRNAYEIGQRESEQPELRAIIIDIEDEQSAHPANTRTWELYRGLLERLAALSPQTESQEPR